MDRVKVKSVDELNRVLGELPPPAPGNVRAYRGQTREHPDPSIGPPAIIPALLRSKTPNANYDPAWLISVKTMLIKTGEFESVTDFELHQVWIPALLQHYGPGSQFIDVTRELEVALWFAFHSYHERNLLKFHDANWLSYLRTSWYKAADPSKELPCLYVFDVKAWSGKVCPAHGEFVEFRGHKNGCQVADLATRISRQSAGMLYSERAKMVGPDLIGLVRLAILLEKSFDITSLQNGTWTVAHFFPGPEADPIYKRLLDIPPVVKFGPRRLEHPLTVPCYLTSTPCVWEIPSLDQIEFDAKNSVWTFASADDFAKIKQQPWNIDVQRFLRNIDPVWPPLFIEWLIAEDESGRWHQRDMQAGTSQFAFKKSLVLLPESALWTFTPAVHPNGERERWIEESLVVDLPEDLSGIDCRSTYVEIPTLDLFSPGETKRSWAPRGVWLVRDHPLYRIRLFWMEDAYHHSIDSSFCYHSSIDLLFEFNSAMGKFSLVEPHPDPGGTAYPTEILDAGLKALFVVLTMLRDLSPGFKPPPIFSSSFTVKYHGKEINVLQAGAITEPQHGVLEHCEGTEFRRPKGIYGGVYARASAFVPDSEKGPANVIERTTIYAKAFQAVSNPFYQCATGPTLAEHLGYLNKFEQALTVVRETKSSSSAAGLIFLETPLDLIEARCLLSLKKQKDASALLTKAIDRENKRGTGEFTHDLRDFLSRPPSWGKVIRYAHLIMVKEPDPAPMFFMTIWYKPPTSTLQRLEAMGLIKS